MINPSLTIITSFFDIQKREGSQRERDNKFYLSSSKTLDLDANMVIFIDPEFYDFVLEKRKGLEKKTIIHKIALEEIENYKFKDKLDENYKVNKIRNSNPKKDTAIYSLVMWSKYLVVNRIVKENPFNSEWFSWMDIGISYISDWTYVEEALNVKPNKFRCILMNYYRYKHHDNDHVYYKRLPWIACGGFSIAPRDVMIIHCERLAKEFIRAVNAGYCPTDEQVIGRLINSHPESYEFSYGDYKSILSNFAGVLRYNVERAYEILTQIRSFESFGLLDHNGRDIKSYLEANHELSDFIQVHKLYNIL